MTRMASQSLLMESMGYSNIQHNKKPFSLSFCKKKFVLKDDVKENEKIHMKEKLFSCTFCEKKFILKDNLKEHERIHSREKPFSCSYCERKFIPKDDLREHENRRKASFRQHWSDGFSSFLVAQLLHRSRGPLRTQP